MPALRALSCTGAGAAGAAAGGGCVWNSCGIHVVPGHGQAGGEDRLCHGRDSRAGLRDPAVHAEGRWVKGCALTEGLSSCPGPVWRAGQGQRAGGTTAVRLTNGSIAACFPSPVLTTVEGIIDRAIAGLEQDQPVRRVRRCDGGGSSGTPARQMPVLAPCSWKRYGLSVCAGASTACAVRPTRVLFRRRQTKGWHRKSRSSSGG